LTRAPVATYRVQLSRAFTFRDLHSLTAYLDALGVSDCYCSPILSAGEGSLHGYDIVNHNALNPELGTREEFAAVSAALRARGIGLIVDFVPNHMGINPRTNAWWRDVLENGPSSPYARFFDIDWLPVKSELRDKVLLPILGDQYGLVLERGELKLRFDNGALVLDYFERDLPINPRQSPLVFGHGIDRLSDSAPDVQADARELRSILEALNALPPMTSTDHAAMEKRQRDKEALRGRLHALAARSPAVAAHIEAAIAHFNGQPGDRASFNALHGLLEVQAYRLAYWRTAFDEINYRRFFDVNDLAALRMEDAAVFAATHALMLDLVAGSLITGLRIDHPDGLSDPTAYFQSLEAAIAARRPLRDAPDVYVVVEKILGRFERLRETWPVHGTTGYNMLNAINGVFVHPIGLADLRRHYRRFTRYRSTAADTVYASKRFMMRSAMASELNVLTRAISRLSEAERRCRDFTLNGLRRALVEVVACFPVYRTYITEQGASADDIAVIDAAIDEARRRNPVQEPSIFAFIRDALLAPAVDTDMAAAAGRALNVAFAHKFQQYTAPVVAKGLEDTAFYNDVLLLSANEVGGDLRHRARPLSELHIGSLHRLTRWPLEMTSGSTHDTKRGEDARARINVISELPDEWRVHVTRWASINDPARARLGEIVAPDRNDEWMFYQALVGAWPAQPAGAPIPAAADSAFVERMQRYMRKALKEAKRHTSWLHENRDYEEAVSVFVQSVLAGELAPVFLASFLPFQRRLAWFGMLGSLAQLVVRLGSPGVPDVYQGSELWNFSLVDPDNRAPVDFDQRRAMLAKLEPLLTAPSIEARAGEGGLQVAGLMENWHDGRVKLFTLATGLRLRRAYPDLFLYGEYEPLGTDGDEPHLIAFSRRHGAQEVIVVVPRFVATMLRGVPAMPLGVERWRTASTRLPRRLAESRLVNVFTEEVITPAVYREVPWLLASSVFQTFPVAMLRVLGSDTAAIRSEADSSAQH
jgi:(1->4)-alpha-D-glucan 1-alpha-D-glucosylmutase